MFNRNFSTFTRNQLIALASSTLFAVSASAYAAEPAPADTAAAQTAASPADAAFLAKAVPAGHEEVMAARTALKMSKSTGVKQAAQMMYQDHHAANQKLAALAKQKGWALPPRDASAATPASYSDDEYVAVQVKAHQEAIVLFKDEASKGSDPDLRAFAQSTLPTLQHHLKTLQALQSS
jgi:putative membrane protein